MAWCQGSSQMAACCCGRSTWRERCGVLWWRLPGFKMNNWHMVVSGWVPPNWCETTCGSQSETESCQVWRSQPVLFCPWGVTSPVSLNGWQGLGMLLLLLLLVLAAVVVVNIPIQLQKATLCGPQFLHSPSFWHGDIQHELDGWLINHKLSM